MHYQSNMFILSTSEAAWKFIKICLKILVLFNININFQTNLQTLFEDSVWNKNVANNVSMNVSVAPIYLKLFSFQWFKEGGYFFRQHWEIFFTLVDCN